MTKRVFESKSGGINGISSEQLLGGIVNGNNNSGYESMTSNATGSVLYTRYHDWAANTLVIKRLEKDPSTGTYSVTHTATSGAIVTDINTGGMCIIGGFLYSLFDDGVTAGIRYNAADLTGAAALTFVGGTGNSNKGVFTDGTFIYSQEGVAGTYEQYSIAGTTLTFVQNITGATPVGVCAIRDASTGRIYMARQDNTVNVYTIVGTAFVSVTSKVYEQLQLFPETSQLEGISFIGSFMYLGFNGSYETQAGDRLSCIRLKAFTRPA